MSNKTKEFWLFWIWGFVMGVFVFAIYSSAFQSRIDGKNVQDWYTQYQETQTAVASGQKDYQNILDVYKGLQQCLLNNPTYQDYYGGRSFIVNDVSDVHGCLLDAQKNQLDKQNLQDSQYGN